MGARPPRALQKNFQKNVHFSDFFGIYKYTHKNWKNDMKITMDLTEQQAIALWASTFEGHVLALENCGTLTEELVLRRALNKFAKALEKRGMVEKYPNSFISNMANDKCLSL